MKMLTKKIPFLLLIVISLISINIAKIKAETRQHPCTENIPLASYELENDWVYICSESAQLFLLQVSKNDRNPVLKVPASGGFPTYAAVQGELSDPHSKIYNISPFYFQIVEASIITKIEPVLRTIEPLIDVVITSLSGEPKKAAFITCNNDKPVQVFETKNSNIYICIEAKENDPNAINLTYVQIDKSNSNAQIHLKAKLISSFRYQTSTQDQISYIISYKGLETYKNGQKITTEPVTNVYLIPSDSTKEGY
jgi:hypothetical protein